MEMNPKVNNIYTERLEQFLQRVLIETPIPAEKIRNAMLYALFPGGKRIRPLLVYLAGELIDVDLKVLDVIAAAVELTHCYSLIHDDLPAMDNDDMRRGKPSCHKAYDEATAILVGDGMQALAIELLLTRLLPLLDAAKIVAISQSLTQASGVSGMVSGQSLDLSELARADLNESQLKEIHLLKTGKLIQACFEMVLRAQDSISEAQEIALKTFAQHLGLVFQIQDDFLDCYAPQHVLGKGHSSDLANQKTTFATLYNQELLAEKIDRHFQIAIDALAVFDNKAWSLIELTKALHQRSIFN